MTSTSEVEPLQGAVVVARDGRGRFAAAVPEELLLPQAQSEIYGWPEVCGLALPDEVLQGVRCAQHHVLLQFWPCVLQSARGASWYESKKVWGMTPPLLFEIDTTKEGDTGTGSGSGNHWSRPVICLMPGTHPYTSLYEDLGGVGVGALCRGNDATFSNEPFSCAIAVRRWMVQTLSNSVGLRSITDWGDRSRVWWNTNGQHFLDEHTLARAIIVPTVEPDVPAAVMVPLTREMVKAAAKGVGSGLVYQPSKGVVDAR